MPASLLDSQLATLEIPSPDEDAWMYDVADAPDAIVSALVARATAA
jgi:gluconate kinase